MIKVHVIFDNFKGKGRVRTEKFEFEVLPRVGEHIKFFEDDYLVARVSHGAESGSISIIAVFEEDEDS